MDVRIARGAALAYALGILVGTLLALPSGLSEHDMEWRPVAEWLPGLAEARGSFVASMWVFHASSVALIVFAVAWARPLPKALLAASGGAFLVETTAILGMGLSGETGALLPFRLHMALLASLLLAGAALVVGASSWSDRTLPRPLAALALASGVLGVLGGPSLLVEPMSHVRTAGIVLWVVFVAAIGIHSRGGRPVA